VKSSELNRSTNKEDKMHFQYIDEAGSTGADLQNKQQPVFVMSSLIVSDEKWKKTDRMVQNVLKEYFGHEPEEGFELHAEELLSPNGDGPFKGHDREKRNGLVKELLTLITNRGHAIFISSIYKQKLKDIDTPNQEFGFDWFYPWQISFDAHLTMFEEFLRSPRTGSTSTGLVIIDHDDDCFDFLRSHANLRQRSKGWRELKKVVEIGYSVSSHANPMIQLSDLIVFTMKKFYETKIDFSSKWPKEAHTFFQDCKDIIWSKVVFKNLSFNKLKVKDTYISFLKEIRKP
jgi:hypothetical protein